MRSKSSLLFFLDIRKLFPALKRIIENIPAVSLSCWAVIFIVQFPVAGFCDYPVVIKDIDAQNPSVKQGVKEAPKEDLLYNQVYISTLNKQKTAFGTFHVKGYVVKIYTCPPCPKDGLCKPCMKDYVVISENNRVLGKEKLTDQDMMVFVNQGSRLEIGKSYLFLIQFLNFKTVNQPVNDPKLIYYKSTEIP